VIQTAFTSILTLIMWSSTNEFMKRDSCASQVQWVFFFAQIHAVTTGRKIALIFTGIFIVGYLALTHHELRKSQWVRARLRLKALPDDTSTDSISTASTNIQPNDGTTSGQSPRPKHKKGKHHGHLEKLKKFSRKRGLWVGNIDRHLIGTTIFQFLILSLLMAWNEMYVHLNESHEGRGQDDTWGFGQIFALIVVFPSVVSLGHALHEHGFRLEPLTEEMGGGEKTEPAKQDSSSPTPPQSPQLATV